MANIYDFNSASLGFDSYDTNLFAKDIIIAQDQLFGNSALARLRLPSHFCI